MRMKIMAIIVGVIISFILGYLSMIFFNNVNTNTHILLSLFWFNILMYIDLRKTKIKAENEMDEN
ncbi:hypothetical protein [Neobacillus sp. D3-1R]|uniref:hypothetical protein n=1 Tax=Neobacillus sp. D3-1R TaxID=3445778 RepID=UPI003FA0DBD9